MLLVYCLLPLNVLVKFQWVLTHEKENQQQLYSIAITAIPQTQERTES